MSRKLLILLGISGLGVGAWWFLKNRNADGPEPEGSRFLPEGWQGTVGASAAEAASIAPPGSGGDGILPTNWRPGSWDAAGQGEVVVPGPGIPEEERRRACGESMRHCYYQYVPEACVDVQRCREEGLI